MTVTVHNIVQLTVKFVLAFLLLPKHFGLLAMAAVFVSFITLFSDLGLSTALIQKEEKALSSLHWHSAFWFNLALSWCIYLVIFFFISSLASQYYNEPIIKPIVRGISLNLLWNPLVFPHRTSLHKGMEFQKLFYANSIPNLVSGIIAIVLAFKGLGVWSLVWQSIINSLLVIPIMVSLKKYAIKLNFSISCLKELFSIGVYDTGIRILGFASIHLNIFLLGTLFSPAIVGYFAFAKSITVGIIDPLNKVMRKVLFPFFSKIQNDIDRISKYHIAQVYNLVVIFLPISGFLLIYSEFVLDYIWGDKWAEAIYPIRILAIYIVILSLSGTPSMVLKSLGKFKLSLKLQFIRFILLRIPAVLIGGTFYGFKGYLVGFIISQVLILVIDYYFIICTTSVKISKILSKLAAPFFAFFCFLAINLLVNKYLISLNLFVAFFAILLSLVQYYLFLIMIRHKSSTINRKTIFHIKNIFEH